MTRGSLEGHVRLLEGIEAATKAIDVAGDPVTAAYWLRYRARLYRRLHHACAKSRLAGTARAAADADDARADRTCRRALP